MVSVEWARRVAEGMLGPVGTRWAHVRRAGLQAQVVGSVVPKEERDLLVAAALVHDVGYAPSIAQTGFHPLDGARWLRTQGVDERLVCLVAHHSAAMVEAERRGLATELAEFEREESAVADALWFVDMTSSAIGEVTTFEARITDILTRYAPGSVVHESITAARPVLAAAVDRTLARLDEGEPATG